MEFTDTAKAIETRYNGRRFRSRKEARWAVFFDSLRLPWEYEKEGFELPSGRYLPDFWMQKQDCWIEIKGSAATERELALAGELAEATNRDVFVFDSPLELYSPEGYATVPWAHAFFAGGGGDCAYLWCECPRCGSLGTQFDGRSDRLPCTQRFEYIQEGLPPWKRRFIKDGCLRSPHGDKGYGYETQRLIAAYCCALSARFEFGEEG